MQLLDRGAIDGSSRPRTTGRSNCRLASRTRRRRRHRTPNPRRPSRLGQPGPAAVGTGSEGRRALHECPDGSAARRGPWRASTSGTSGRSPETRLTPLTLTLVGSLYRKSWRSCSVKSRFGLSESRKPILQQSHRPPAVDLVGPPRPLADRPEIVEELREVDIGDRAAAFAAWAHAAGAGAGRRPG